MSQQLSQQQVLAVNFGTWHGTPNADLFTHTENDGRTAITLHSDALVKDHTGGVCAKRTAKKVRGMLEKQLGVNFDAHHIRWHKSAEVKKLLGDNAGKLVTFIHEHLTVQ